MISETILDKYFSLFLHNNSLYIIHNGRTWLTEKSEVTPELIKKHLERQIIIGLQPQKDDGTVKWVAIDFDAHKDEPLEEIKRTKRFKKTPCRNKSCEVQEGWLRKSVRQ